MKRFVRSLVAGTAVLVTCSVLAASQTTFNTFDDFLKQHSTTIFATEKDSLFSLFWRQALKQGIPWIDSNKTDVTFLYRGAADSVKLYGDFTSWTFKLRLKKLPETDLFYLKLSFEQDARLDYKLIVNEKDQLDPFNKNIAQSGFGVNSELAMPDFVHSSEQNENEKAPKGMLATLNHTSKILGYEHKILVYLPAGYDTGKTPCPVVYFQDGTDYVNLAKTPTILDNMIASKSIPPLIGVFIAPPTEPTRNRATEYGLNDAYVKFLSTELIPFIDKKYRTNQTSEGRFVIGASYGGLISLYAGFMNPNQFSAVASQSGYVSFRSDTLTLSSTETVRLLEYVGRTDKLSRPTTKDTLRTGFSPASMGQLQTMFKQSPAKPIRVYVDVGTYEKNVGGSLKGPNESNFYSANRSFRRILVDKEYDYEYREFHDGHGWARWRNELPYIFRWFFTAAKQK